MPAIRAVIGMVLDAQHSTVKLVAIFTPKLPDSSRVTLERDEHILQVGRKVQPCAFGVMPRSVEDGKKLATLIASMNATVESTIFAKVNHTVAIIELYFQSKYRKKEVIRELRKDPR